MQSSPLLRLQSSMTKLQQLPQFASRLEKSGLLNSLSQAISQVFVTESGCMSSNEIRENLTVICSLLISDSMHRSDSGFTSPRKTGSTTDTSRGLELDISARSMPSSAIKPSHSAANLPRRNYTPGKKSISELQMFSPKQNASVMSLTQSQLDDLRAISDFSVPVPSAVFTRAKRKTMEVHEVSPGPAHYRPELKATKPRCTQPFIPQSGKRFEFEVPDTPAPSYYTPVRTFLAGHRHTKSVA